MSLSDWFKEYLFGVNDEGANNDRGEGSDRNDHHGILSSNLGTDASSLQVARLSSVIEEYYGTSSDDAKVLAEMVKEGLEEGLGYGKISRMAEDEGVELSRDEIMTILWTEKAGFRTRESVRRYNQQEQAVDVDWLVPRDHDGVSPVCIEISDEIDRRGGSVSLEELHTIIREQAQKHAEGTPERVDDWIPHKRCKSAITPSI